MNPLVACSEDFGSERLLSFGSRMSCQQLRRSSRKFWLLSEELSLDRWLDTFRKYLQNHF